LNLVFIGAKTYSGVVTEDEKRAAYLAMRRAIEKRYRDSHPEYRKKKIERAARWKAANRDRVNALDKKIRDADPSVHRARGKKWRDANPERVKELARARYAAKTANKPRREKVTAEHTRVRKKENKKNWCEKNADKVRAYKRDWAAAHPERAKEANKARNRRWIEANREKARAQRRKAAKLYAERHPEKHSIYRLRGHANRKSRGRCAGSFTLEEWNQLLDDTGHKCLSCGIPEKEAIYRYPKAGQPLIGKLTRDHIVPLSQDGAGTIDNIAPLCLPCNTRKHAKHIDYRKPGDGAGGRRSARG
jgi:hypothetical protein